MDSFRAWGRNVLALALVAIPTFAVAAPQTGGVLNVGLQSQPVSLDPAGQSGDASAQVLMYSIFDPLIDVQADGSWKPALALQVDRSPDSRVWTVTLRRGVRFHDGTPFDAQAVAAHFKRLADPAVRCTCLAVVQAIDSIETPAPDKVVFRLASGWVGFPVQVLGAGFAFIPSPAGVAAAGADVAVKPVGTGPFKLVQFARGDRIVVERNPTYWRNGLPYLDQIVFRPLPDEQTRLQSLRAGDIDLMQTSSLKQVEQAEAVGLKAQVNIGQGAQLIVFNNAREPFDDPRVRRALSLALNREALVKLVGITSPGRASLTEGSPTVGNAAWAGFDPISARALIAEYGKPVAFELAVPASPDARKVAEILQQMWRAVGVQVKIAAFDMPQLIQRVLIKKDYQAAGWLGQEHAGPDGLYDAYHSRGRFNVMRYANPKVDSLLELMRLNPDPKVRLESVHQANALIARDAPLINVTRKVGALVYKPRVQDVPSAEWVGVQIFRPTAIWLKQQ